MLCGSVRRYGDVFRSRVGCVPVCIGRCVVCFVPGALCGDIRSRIGFGLVFGRAFHLAGLRCLCLFRGERGQELEIHVGLVQLHFLQLTGQGSGADVVAFLLQARTALRAEHGFGSHGLAAERAVQRHRLVFAAMARVELLQLFGNLGLLAVDGRDAVVQNLAAPARARIRFRLLIHERAQIGSQIRSLRRQLVGADAQLFGALGYGWLL